MTTSKGGKAATGAIKWMRNAKTGAIHWHGRVTLPGGKRPWAPLDPSIPRDDEARAKACAVETAVWFRTHPMVEGKVEETVAEYAKRWLADREARVNSIRDDRGRMTHHVLPVLGPLDVATFTRDDVERFRDELDTKITKGNLSWKTAANCWTLATSMCSDMVNAKRRELRTRKDNPCTDVRAPERGADKAKQFLYPSEFLQFIESEAVPRRWRRAVAAAIYTFTRDGELRCMRWQDGDVDLDHGILSITRAYNRRTGRIKPTKTGETRRFALDANILPLLKAMHEEKCGEGPVVMLASERAMARNLRRWLWKAGVRRPELHEGSPTRKPLTWHDLRATGITWMAVRGDDPLKIKQRAGHTTFSTTEIYIREAEAVREGFGDVFPALPAELLGLDPVRPGTNLGERNTGKTSGSQRGGRDSNPRPPA
jgi:integrase